MNWIRPSEAAKTGRSLGAYALVIGLVCAAALALGTAGDDARSALRYERELVPSELWRVVSAHLVHLGASHLAMNLVAFVVMAILFYPFIATSRLVLTLLTTALGISCSLFLFFPEIQWYVGLSGILHGLLLVGASFWFRAGDRFAAVLILGLVAKLMYEAMSGPLPLTESAAGGPVLTEAHWLGALTALPCLWGIWRST